MNNSNEKKKNIYKAIGFCFLKAQNVRFQDESFKLITLELALSNKIHIQIKDMRTTTFSIQLF